MPYASALEAQIAKQATRAIVEFGLIDDGDRIMVAVSGGKDSWTLIQILDVLRRRAPIRFSLVALVVDPGYGDYQHGLVAAACEEHGWECRVEHASIGRVVGELIAPGETPCSLCARLRRGVLYRVAGEIGATKIALGHHADDFLDTLLLNLLFAGALRAMPARLVADRGHVVIRPLAFVAEDECRAYAEACGLPIVECRCPVLGDPGLQRHQVRQLVRQLEREHPGTRASMMRALRNVAPGHLLDARLHPSAPRTREGAAWPEDDAGPGETGAPVPVVTDRASSREP